MLFLFRLAWALKKTVTELLTSTPEWEIEMWKRVFELCGPLDWRRDDFLVARVNQYQALSGYPLGDFILFRDPTEKEHKQTEDELIEKLGGRDAPAGGTSYRSDN